MDINEMMSILRNETIQTWFDLGLFIDKFKENKEVKVSEFSGSYDDFLKSLSDGGIAFITFAYSIDGVSMEIEKYAKSFRSIIQDLPLHYIGGKFDEKSEPFIPDGVRCFQLDELSSFDEWPLYKNFFDQKLERGGNIYNDLIFEFWSEVLIVTEKLGYYIEENNIKLLYLVNTNSNPGNISLALALVLLSEFLGIPVINNNHDFYWEGGNSELDLQKNEAKPGLRDHFFKNFHIGEVFSIIERVFPWESRTWISVNINHIQSKVLINQHGHNPANIDQIGTEINFDKFNKIADDLGKREVFHQLAAIFKDGKKSISVYSISKILEKKLKSSDEIFPLLIGAEGEKEFNFENNNIILLQPTRIVARKRIEVNFRLIDKLFSDEEFCSFFEKNKKLHITLLVTGPIAIGHFKYFMQILEHYNSQLMNLNQEMRNRFLLGFLFSEFDKPSFKARFSNPIGIGELFNIASLAVLPSETEGRGLPILEAAAAGTPLFCRRFSPEEVYSRVIGDHLAKEDRIRNMDFTDSQLNFDLIEAIKYTIFSPKGYKRNAVHNKEAVEHRYSTSALRKDLEKILFRLFLQITSGEESFQLAKDALKEYKDHIAANKGFAQKILSTNKRQYLPGYGQMAYMLFLKSLIDPSYFRVEEKRVRGMAMQFAKELVDKNRAPSPLSQEEIHRFFNSVDSIFRYRDGEIPIQMDHSFAYRHRNKNHYSYRELTPQELTGVINLLFNKITSPPPAIRIEKTKRLSKDWHKNLSLLYEDSELAIDHIDELESKLFSNIPIAIFLEDQIELGLELFVLQPVREQLGLKADEEIRARDLIRGNFAPIFIIQRNKALGEMMTAEVLKSYVYYDAESELKLLFKHNICQIIGSEQYSVGIHFYEVGQKVIQVLQQVKEGNGIIVALGDHAANMTDIVDLDRFHIGQVSHPQASKIMGIPMGSGYVQWVPASMRFSLSYPVPVQTGNDFSKALKSFRYQKLCDSFGEVEVLQILKKDAEDKGTPIKTVLRNMDQQTDSKSDVSYSSINGLYSDGLPWAGVFAKINLQHSVNKLQFSVMSTKAKPKTVLEFVDDFNLTNHGIAKVAWNGGYILNSELVGKLGLSEKFIGSPLGLIISQKKVLSPPLFNKPAFFVLQDGSIKIKRVNSSKGITVSDSLNTIRFSPQTYNSKYPINSPCYYDLLYDDDQIIGNDRVIVRLSGNVIIEIVYTKENEPVSVLPVGLTLSFPKEQFPNTWKIGMHLDLKMNDWEEFESAIEAGPLLIKEGEICIDMEIEGWLTSNSINSQAARMDYLDSRGPKIAVGIDKTGDLTVLTVNGRIRESVGATHGDMADILKAQGLEYAMGFDPGGSSTLVVENKILNISPYNSGYERDIYSLPPQLRAISNAMVISEI